MAHPRRIFLDHHLPADEIRLTPPPRYPDCTVALNDFLLLLITLD